MTHRPATPEIGTQLGNLYYSAHDLIDRFNVKPDSMVAWAKFQEEVYELYQEYCAPPGEEDPNKFAAEAADVLVTLFNFVRAANITEAQFIEAIRATWRKNDQKDGSTHTVEGGFIVRIKENND